MFTLHDFPNTSMYDSDLKEIIRLMKALERDYNYIVTRVNPTFANPVYWDINNRYRLLTYVQDGEGGAWYVSIKDVPPGIYLDNEEYWVKLTVGTDVTIEDLKTAVEAVQNDLSQKIYMRPTTICQGRIDITLPVENITTLESTCFANGKLFIIFFNNSRGACIGRFPIGESPIVAEKYVADMRMGHGNSLTFDGSYLYTVTYTDNNLVRINPNTLEIEIVHSFSKNYLNCVYDDERKVFYLMPATWDNTVDIMDTSYNIIGSMYIDIPPARQAPYCNGKYLFFLQSGLCNYIYAVNKWTGNCEGITAINLTDELESIFYANGTYYAAFNNQLTNTDYYIGINLNNSNQTSKQFTQDAIGRNIKLTSNTITQTGDFPLMASPEYFSHIVFKLGSASGNYIGDVEVEINYSKDSGYATKVHVTSGGNVWHMGFSYAIKNDSVSATMGTITIGYLTLAETSAAGVFAVHKSTDGDWGTEGFQILSVYGICKTQVAQNIGS